MKKKSLSHILFFFVLFIIVLPPIVGQFFLDRPDELVVYYPLSVFILVGISFFIYIFSLKGFVFEKTVEGKKQPFFVYSSNALVCFGFICLTSVLFEALAWFLGVKSGIHNVVFPESFLGFVNFFFGVIFAAFSEEVIYRFYLPAAFKEILSRKIHDNQRLSVFCEVLSLLLFSLGHIYLGIFGFLNALICGIALRYCMVRTKSIWTSFAVHTVYNFLSFLFFWCLVNSFA